MSYTDEERRQQRAAYFAARAGVGAVGGAGAPAPPAPKYGEVFIPKNVISAHDSTGYPTGYPYGPSSAMPKITPETFHMSPSRQTSTDIVFSGIPGNMERNIIIKKPWDRYFIYQHLRLQNYSSTRLDYGTLFTQTVGLLVDNHGQAYKFTMKSLPGMYNDRGDITITADPSLPPLTNPQIDYVKKQAEALGYASPGVNAAEMRALFGDESARADHTRCVEEAARVRERLAQRDEELRIATTERDTLQARINTAARAIANHAARRAAEREVPGAVAYNPTDVNAAVGNPTVNVNPLGANGNNPQGGGMRKTRRHRTRRTKTTKRKYHTRA